MWLEVASRRKNLTEPRSCTSFGVLGRCADLQSDTFVSLNIGVLSYNSWKLQNYTDRDLLLTLD